MLAHVTPTPYSTYSPTPTPETNIGYAPSKFENLVSAEFQPGLYPPLEANSYATPKPVPTPTTVIPEVPSAIDWGNSPTIKPEDSWGETGVGVGLWGGATGLGAVATGGPVTTALTLGALMAAASFGDSVDVGMTPVTTDNPDTFSETTQNSSANT